MISFSCRPGTVRVMALFSMVGPCAWGFRISSEAAFLDEAPRFTVDENCERLSRTYQDICKRSPFIDAYSGTGAGEEELVKEESSWLQSTFDRLHTLRKELAAFVAQCPSNYRVEEEAVLRSRMGEMDNQATAVLEGGNNNKSSARNVGEEADDSLSAKLKRLAAALGARFALHHFFPSEEACEEAAPAPAERSSVVAAPFFQMRAAKAWRRCLSARRSFAEARCGEYMHAKQVWRAELKFFRSAKRNEEDALLMKEEKEMAHARNYRHANAEGEMFGMWIPVVEEAIDFVRELELRKAGAVLLQNRTRLMVGVAAKMGILEEQEGSSEEDGSSLEGTSAEVSDETDSKAAETHRNARARDRAKLASRWSQVRSWREEIEGILFDERKKQEARAAARHGTERARLLAASVAEEFLELKEGDEERVLSNNDVPLPTEEGGPLRRVWEIIALLERSGPIWMEGLSAVTVNQKELAKLERRRQKLLAFAEQAVDTLEKLEVVEAEAGLQVGTEGSASDSLSASAAEQLAAFRAAEDKDFEAKLSALFSSKSATEWAAHDLGLLAGREAVESWEASHRKAMSMDDTREAILDKIWARTSPALEGDAGSLEDDVMEDVDKQFKFLSIRLQHRQSEQRLQTRLRKLRSARLQRDCSGTQIARESEEETAFHAAFLDGYQLAWREKTVENGLQLGRSGLESLETGVRAFDAYADYCKAELELLVIDDITRQVRQDHGLMKNGVAAFGALCGPAWTGSVPPPAGGRPGGGDMTKNEAEIWEWLESSAVAQEMGVPETIEKIQESLYYLIPRGGAPPEEQGLEASLLPSDNMSMMHAAIKQVESNARRSLLPSAVGSSKREKAKRAELVKVLVNAERDRGLLKAWEQNWRYAAQLGLVETRWGQDEVASWQAASPAERLAAKSVDGAWGFILTKFLVSAFGGGGLSVRRVRQEPFPGVLLKDTVHLDMLELPNPAGRNKILKNPSSGDGGKAVRLMLLRFRRMGMRRAVLREGVGGGHLGLGQGERERFSAAVAAAKEKARDSEESGRGVWSTSDRMLYLWNNVVEGGAGDDPHAVHDVQDDDEHEQKAQRKLLESEIPEVLRSLENWKTLSTTDRLWWLGGEVAPSPDTPQTPMNVVFEQGLSRLLKKFLDFQASEQLAEPTTGQAFFNAYQAVLELCGYRPIHPNFAALREHLTGAGSHLHARDMVIPLFAHDYWHGRSMDGREQHANSVGEIFVDDSERALSQARMLFLLKKVMVMEALTAQQERRKRWGVESPAEWTEWIVQRMLAGGCRPDEILIQQQGHQGQLQGSSSAAARPQLCDLGRDDDSGGRCSHDVRSSRRQEEAALLSFGSSLSSIFSSQTGTSTGGRAQDGGDPNPPEHRTEVEFRESAPEWVSLVAQQGERQADERGGRNVDENASLLQQYESVIEEYLSNGTGIGLVGLFELDEALWLRSEVKQEEQELRRSREADRKKAGRNSKASAAAARQRLEEGSKALEELRNASLENLRQRDDIMRNRWKLWIVAKYRVILKKKSIFKKNGCTAESLASLQDQLSHLQNEFVAGQDAALEGGAVAASKMKGVDDDVRQILDTFLKRATNEMASAAMGRLSSSAAMGRAGKNRSPSLPSTHALAFGEELIIKDADDSFGAKELLDACAENALALAVVAEGDRPLTCDQVERTQGKICEAEEEDLH